MHKSQTRLSACCTWGTDRRILLPMHACRKAGNEYLSQEEPLDYRVAFYGVAAASFSFADADY